MDDPEQAGIIEAVDPSEGSSDLGDSDSGYGEPSLSTASLRSSIFDYEEEFGRSYHAFRRGKYVMPNDEQEQDRMDIHYHSLRITMEDKLYISPTENPSAVLDVGTGECVSSYLSSSLLLTMVMLRCRMTDYPDLLQGLASGQWTSQTTIHPRTSLELTCHQSSQQQSLRTLSFKSWT